MEKGRGWAQYPPRFKPCTSDPQGFLGYQKKKKKKKKQLIGIRLTVHRRFQVLLPPVISCNNILKSYEYNGWRLYIKRYIFDDSLIMMPVVITMYLKLTTERCGGTVEIYSQALGMENFYCMEHFIPLVVLLGMNLD